MSQQQPGRYQRSFSGLVASMLVTVLLIVGFVVLREAFRADVDTRPEPVDYLATVGFAQRDGLELVYPADLPEGWIATSVDLEPGRPAAWGIGMLTDDESFVGIRQEDAAVDDLIATYVDEDPVDVEDLGERQVTSEVADRWQVFADTGGDLAYAAEVDDEVVLVYGSADRAALEAVVERLTFAPVS